MSKNLFNDMINGLQISPSMKSAVITLRKNCFESEGIPDEEDYEQSYSAASFDHFESENDNNTPDILDVIAKPHTINTTEEDDSEYTDSKLGKTISNIISSNYTSSHTTESLQNYLYNINRYKIKLGTILNDKSDATSFNAYTYLTSTISLLSRIADSIDSITNTDIMNISEKVADIMEDTCNELTGRSSMNGKELMMERADVSIPVENVNDDDITSTYVNNLWNRKMKHLNTAMSVLGLKNKHAEDILSNNTSTNEINFVSMDDEDIINIIRTTLTKYTALITSGAKPDDNSIVNKSFSSTLNEIASAKSARDYLKHIKRNALKQLHDKAKTHQPIQNTSVSSATLLKQSAQNDNEWE